MSPFRRLAWPLMSRRAAAETLLTPEDRPWLAGAIVFGGVEGPILLMTGLQRTDAATASLLLTPEGVATALLAWFVFHENFDRRIALGMSCLVAGAIAMTWDGPHHIRVGWAPCRLPARSISRPASGEEGRSQAWRRCLQRDWWAS